MNLKDDTPIDTASRQSSAKAEKLSPATVPEMGLDDLDLDLGGSGGIEEAASGLLDLLN